MSFVNQFKNYFSNSTARRIGLRKVLGKRYARGGNSGGGSFGTNAEYKANVVNKIIQLEKVESVLEFGCGDGNQLTLFNFDYYTGLDISQTAISRCESMYTNHSKKKFLRIIPGQDLQINKHDAVISLEVLMHITNENDFKWTLDQIFKFSAGIVIIQIPILPLVRYKKGSHERYRNILPYLAKYLGEFDLVSLLIHPSTSIEGRLRNEIGQMSSDFLVFKRKRPQNSQGLIN